MNDNPTQPVLRLFVGTQFGAHFKRFHGELEAVVELLASRLLPVVLETLEHADQHVRQALELDELVGTHFAFAFVAAVRVVALQSLRPG